MMVEQRWRLLPVRLATVLPPGTAVPGARHGGRADDARP